MFFIEKEFDPRKLERYFTEKVRLACTFCKRYGTKATCPPHIESVKYYSEVLPEYAKGVLLIHKFSVKCEAAGDGPCGLPEGPNWKELGRETTQRLNTHVVSYRHNLLQQGHHIHFGLGSGSCKICKTCSFPCRHPENSLIPIEGTGLDVIRLVKDLTELELSFPVKNIFYRVGAVFYD